jgi:choline dehydrogenase
VLILERGSIVDTWASHVPLLSIDFRPATAPNHRWLAAPLAAAIDTPPIEMITGKAVGGTSKINTCIYLRSVPGDYNAWAEAGRKDWGWKDVEPHYISMENALSDRAPHRGSKGTYPCHYISSQRRL